jgi:hypothetical protein
MGLTRGRPHAYDGLGGAVSCVWGGLRAEGKPCGRTLCEDRGVPFPSKPNAVALVLSNRMPPEDLAVTALAYPRASGRSRDA